VVGYHRFRGPCCFHHQGGSGGGSMDLWNIGILPRHYTAPQLRGTRLAAFIYLWLSVVFQSLDFFAKQKVPVCVVILSLYLLYKIHLQECFKCLPPYKSSSLLLNAYRALFLGV